MASFWDNLTNPDTGTDIYNTLNKATFGIPDEIVKAADSDAYKKLQEYRASKGDKTNTLGENLRKANNLVAEAQNQTFRGIPDALLSKLITPEQLSAYQAQRKADQPTGALKTIKDTLGTGFESAQNSALYGIPDVIAKNVNPDYYKQLQAERASNQGADIAGSLAGAFAPTGGGLLKGLGAGAEAIKSGNIVAKGLNAAGKLISEGGRLGKATKGIGGLFNTVGSGIARGGLAGLEQLAPRTIAGETDLGDAGTGIAGSALLGGAGGLVESAVPHIANILNRAHMLDNPTGFMNGAAGYTAADAVPEIAGARLINPLKEHLNDAELAAHDINSKAIKMANNKTAKLYGIDPTGNAINNARESKQAALDFINTNNLQGKNDIREAIQGTGRTFDAANAQYDAQGIKPSTLLPAILEHPAVKEFLESNPEEGQKLIDSTLATLDRSSGVGSAKKILDKRIAFANKAVTPLESEFGDVAHAIKDTLNDRVIQNGAPQFQNAMQNWKAMGPLRYALAREEMNVPSASAGSSTIPKALATGLLSGGMGSIAGIPGAIAGLVGGEALNGVLPHVTNYIAGQAAHALNKPEVLAGIGKIAAGIPNVANSALLGGERAISELKAGQNTDAQAQGAPVANVSSGNGITVTPSATTAEGKPISAVAEEKKAEYGPEYISKLNDKMSQYWSNNFSDRMSYDDYVARVAQVTDNFSPKKAAGFLYPEPAERAKFLKDLEVSQRIKGMDIGDIYSKPNMLQNITEMGSGKGEMRTKQKLDLVNTIASLVTKEGTVPTGEALKQINADVSAIMNLKMTGDEKKNALMQTLAQNYGLGYDDLKTMGLV